MLYTAIMSNTRILQIGALVIVAAVALFLLKKPDVVVTDFQSCEKAGGTIIDGEPVKCEINGTTFEEAQHAEPEVVVEQPVYGALVTSPLSVKGKARGFWYFEANIPVTLKDQNGKILAQKGFMSTENWMTEDYVPFEGTLEFATPETDYGVLLIQKDNPSGDPRFDASVAVPVRFK